LTLRDRLTQAREEAADATPLVFCSISAEYLDAYNEYIAMDDVGGLTVWSEARVYFPLTYDGGLWIGSAPRDPCLEIVKPMGGG
jgi:hypothetical protein